MKNNYESELRKISDKLESLKGELDDLEGDIEQCCLNAYDQGSEDGYKEGYEAGCEDTEKKLAE